MALRLLVVDDELDVLKAVQSILNSLGYQSVGLTDSREAQTRVDREKLDGVFLDACMPNIDGFGLAQHIRQSRSNSAIPIVMVTAYADAETMRKGLDAGVTFFITKPPEVKKIEHLLKLMHGAMLMEKRRYARLHFRTMVDCVYKQHQFKSESLNICEGGMLLEGSGGVGVEEEISLQFSLPKPANLITARAKVVRHEAPDRIGVQFMHLDLESKRALQDHIARFVLD